MAITYSTWVDDLAFSGQNARMIIPVVITSLREAGLRVSRRKIKVMGACSQKILNGIIVGKYPLVLRENISRIRAGVHKLAIDAVEPHLHRRYLISLVGRIRQAEMVNPQQVHKLRSKLVEVLQQSAVSRSLKRHYLEILRKPVAAFIVSSA